MNPWGFLVQKLNLRQISNKHYRCKRLQDSRKHFHTNHQRQREFRLTCCPLSPSGMGHSTAGGCFNSQMDTSKYPVSSLPSPEIKQPLFSEESRQMFDRNFFNEFLVIANPIQSFACNTTWDTDPHSSPVEFFLCRKATLRIMASVFFLNPSLALFFLDFINCWTYKPRR